MKNPSRITMIVSTMLSSLLALLGFSGCDNEVLVEYGTPHADFKITGLVDSGAGAPVAKARIITRQIKLKGTEDLPQDRDVNGYSLIYGCDTTYTDDAGRYTLMGYSYLSSREIEIVAEKPDDGYAPAYKLTELEYKGGDGRWNIGTATATINFTLQKDDTND